MAQTASETCKAFIGECEGTKLAVYPDSNGNPTIGTGHKLTASEIVKGTYDKGITTLDAELLFEVDLAKVESQVNSLALTLSQGQYDACVSFCYNLGICDLKTMLGHGMASVPNQIQRWVYADHKIEPGLVKRRKQELEWWNS